MTWTAPQRCHSSASLTNSVWITLWAREQHPQVSQVQRHTQEQHRQDDSVEKEQGWFPHALRREREQEHHPLPTPVRYREREGEKCSSTFACHAGCYKSTQKKQNSNPIAVSFFLLWISHFIGNSTLGACLFSGSSHDSVRVFLDLLFGYFFIPPYSISKISSSTTVLQLNIVFHGHSIYILIISWT